ncbi:MAG: hypothetical protein HOJ35_09525 [Bdellovibrionales bacterium]|nr:hypothetical protein [Bdellovibrionales bacterium]
MKNLKLLTLVIILCSFTNLAQAESFQDKMKPYLEKLRPYVLEYLGEEWETKLIGARPETVTLPEIPKVIKDATSTEGFDHEEDPNIKNMEEEDIEHFNYLFINELFNVVRNMSPNENDLAKWMNVMNQNATREGVYRALVLDNYYARMENYEKPVSNKVIELTQFLLEGYMGQTIKKDTISQFNFYTLKRMIAERSLEIIDAFKKNKTDMHRWYAVLSGDLAKKYPYVWTNSIRLNKSREKHLSWAKSVPVQHIKSEVIIKIHKVYNKVMEL